MAFYFSSETMAFYDTDVFPVASLPENKVEVNEADYTDLMQKQNQGYVIKADNSGNPYAVSQGESTATDMKHSGSIATTLALGHVKIGNTMTAANDGTLDVKDDAITANKVKDNETLPVNISGSSHSVLPFIISKSAQTTNVWAKVATASVSAWNGYAITLAAGFDGYSNASAYAAEIVVGYQVASGGSYANRQFNIYRRRYSSTNVLDAKLLRIGDTLELWIKDNISDTNLYLVPVYSKGFGLNYADSNNRTKQLTDSDFTEYIADKTKYDAEIRTITFIPGISQVGSIDTPVYVDSNGMVQECDTSRFIADEAVTSEKIANLNVTNDKLAANAVTTAKIANLNVTNDKLAANAVTTAKIANLNVTNEKLAAKSVTREKLADALVPAVLPFVDVNGSNLNGTTWSKTWSEGETQDHLGNIGSYTSGRLVDFTIQADFGIQQASVPSSPNRFDIIVWHGTVPITNEKIYDRRTVTCNEKTLLVRERFSFITSANDNIKINVAPVQLTHDRFELNYINLKGFVF